MAEYDTVISGNIGSGVIGSVHIGDSQILSGNIGSGQVSQFHLASGAVTAAGLGSGAVVSGNIASGSIGHFHIASGAIQSGQIGSGTVQGSLGSTIHIASGTVGPTDLGSGAILSGAIASGQVGSVAISSGSVTSGRLGTTGTPDGTKFLRDDFAWSAPAFSLTSGQVGSGLIASGAVDGFFGLSRRIQSGTIGVFDFGSGAVVVGTIGSGAVVSGNIASGQVGPNHLGSGAVLSGTIASGQIGPNHLGSGAVLSGAIASGQVGRFHIASGAVPYAPSAQQIILSGLVTAESISGVWALAYNLSGQIIQAMAASSGRMPAIGVVNAGNLNIDSGQTVTVVIGGRAEIIPGIGLVAGQPMYVGLSGDLVQGPPTLSGAIIQEVGFNSVSSTRSGIYVQMAVPGSGDITGQRISSGSITSGKLGTTGTPDGTKFLRDDFVWTAPTATVGSGAIGSGLIASGAVDGFFGVSRRIQSGTVGSFDFGSGAVIAGTVGSGAVVSGNIASGQIGPNHLGSGAILSGAIASGQIGPNHLGSGAVLSGAIASGQIGPNHHGSGSVLSGAIASGQIGPNHLGSGAVNSGSIASGTVSQFKLASGAVNSGQINDSAVVSGSYASGSIGNFPMAANSVISGAVGSGAVIGAVGGGNRNVASGTLAHFDFGSGAVLSGDIASGQIGAGHLGSGSVLSGSIGSGQVGNFHISSGSVTSGRLGTTGTPDGTKFLRDDFAWTAPTAAVGSGGVQSGMIASGAVQGFFGSTRHIASGTIGVFDLGSGALQSGASASGFVAAVAVQGVTLCYAMEPISGIRAVQLIGEMSGLGMARIAMADSLTRMPAQGLVLDNVDSGQPMKVYTLGYVLLPPSASGLISITGGQGYYVNRSGLITLTPPTTFSGGQLIATGANNSGLFIAAMPMGNTNIPVPSIFAGGIVSGSITFSDISSGSIRSGHMASGSVQGFFGGIRNIASGTVGVSDLGSGAVLSGAIASGQIGPNHLGSGAVLSGAIASGQIGPNHLGSGAVLSGAIASGQVGQFHLASGSVTSGSILSGQVSQFKMASGAINSGAIASGAWPNAAYGLWYDQNIFANSTISGRILGSGIVNAVCLTQGLSGNSLVTLSDPFAVPSLLAFGVILNNVLSGAPVSVLRKGVVSVIGSLAAGGAQLYVGSGGNIVVGAPVAMPTTSPYQTAGFVLNVSGVGAAIANDVYFDMTQIGTADVNTSRYTTASIQAFAMASGSVLSGHIGSGQVGPFKLSSGSVSSGQINSGNIITYNRVDCEDSFVTTEIISGVRAVQVNGSGFLRIAMAAVSGRMPADGIAFANALSGAALLMVVTGKNVGPAAEIGSGLCISGRQFSNLWVGASGQLVTISGGGPTIGIGAGNSGGQGQMIGRIVTSGAVFVNVNPGPVFSGAAVITTNSQFWPL